MSAGSGMAKLDLTTKGQQISNEFLIFSELGLAPSTQDTQQIQLLKPARKQNKALLV